jgi:hypothetical protein
MCRTLRKPTHSRESDGCGLSKLQKRELFDVNEGFFLNILCRETPCNGQKIVAISIRF